MNDNGLQFEDDEINELFAAEALYVDQGRFKKDDDLRRPAALPPAPLSALPVSSSSSSLHAKRRPAVHASHSPSASSAKLCRLAAVLGFVACILFLFGFLVVSLLGEFKHHDHQSGHGVHTPMGPVVAAGQGALALANATSTMALPGLSTVFTTGPTVQSYVAYDLSTSFPGLVFSTLKNYQTCCWVKDGSRFICGSGYTFSNGLALDSYLAKESEGQLSLYLNVNSNDLAESRCKLTLWTDLS